MSPQRAEKLLAIRLPDLHEFVVRSRDDLLAVAGEVNAPDVLIVSLDGHAVSFASGEQSEKKISCEYKESFQSLMVRSLEQETIWFPFPENSISLTAS